MKYEIYVGNDLIVTALSIEDLLYYINVNQLEIIEETEDIKNNTIILDCENRQEVNQYGIASIYYIMRISVCMFK